MSREIGATQSRKIFGIGLSRTGTHSLAEALSLLGYRAAHWGITRTLIKYRPWGIVVDHARFRRHDAFLDIPIARVYQQLDQTYPGSKFILTVRDPEAWVESLKSHMDRARSKGLLSVAEALWQDFYGTPPRTSEKLREAYQAHSRGVLSYFETRRDDLLVLDICAGEGWERLCPFLGDDVPLHEFPHNWAHGSDGKTQS